MKKLLSFVALSLYVTTLTAQEQQLQALTSQYGIPGVQLVVMRGGKTEIHNWGFTNQDAHKEITSNTVFEAASLSKAVFAYTVMRLYDRGVLSLDTPLLHYIGTYDRFDPADPRYEKITARMVLRHTTGLPNWGDEYARLIFTPDSTYSYSGEGFQYLQKVVEKLTGMGLQELVQQEVFTPLSMTLSSYIWTSKFDTLSAFGNDPEAVKWHTKAMAAASLLTCAHDYALFLRAVMAGTGLKPATHRMMLERQSAGVWFKHRVTPANQHIWWGLGIGIQANETGDWIWQWGDNGDFKGFFIANPKKKEALVYFTYSKWGLHITTEVLDAFFQKQTWWVPVWIGYEFYEKKNMLAFWTRLEKEGYDHAEEIAKDLKQQDTAFKLPESDVNDLGFILLGKNRKKEAIGILKYNLAANPNSADACIGLADAYDNMGEKQLVIENLRRAVVLAPRNNNVAERLKKLEDETKK